MDLGTIGGFVTVVGLILAGILMGSSLMIFVDPASIAIVVAGTIAILFVGFPAGNVMSSLKGAKNAIFPKSLETESTVKALEELSNRARREGLLSLEEAAATADDEVVEASGGIGVVRAVIAQTIRDRPDQVMFGSDWPMCRMQAHLDLVNSLDLDRATRNKVLDENAAALYDLPA